MVVTKYLGLILVSMFLVSVSFGLNWDIITSSNKTLIFGYINYNHSVNLNLEVKDGSGNTYYNGGVEFSSDYNTDDIVSGVFYKEIELKDGDYIAKIYVDNQSFTNEFKVANSGFVSPKIIDVSQNSDNTTVYINVTNNGKSDFNGTLYVYYKNGKYPEKINVDAENSKLIKIVLSTKDFGTNTLIAAYVDGNYDYKLFKSENESMGDYKVETSTISIERGTTEDFKFKVRNLNNYHINLDITYESNLYVYGDNYISLGPKEEKTFTFSISVPRDFNDTPYLKIEVGNKEKDVDVRILPNQEIDLDVDNIVAHPGDVIDNYVVVKNVGDVKENINFSYEVFGSKYIYPFKISIEPGDEYKFPFYLFIPKDQSEDVKVKFFVNGVEYDKYITVEPYIREFELSSNQTEIYLMDGNSTVIDLFVNNIGNVKDKYTINIGGWNYYSLNKNSFVLAPGESTDVKIRINSFNDTKIGNYNLKIEVCGYKCENITIPIVMDKPEADKVKIEFYGKENQTFEDNKTINYTISIKNEDIKEKDYLIEVNEFGVHKRIDLKPDEEKNVTLQIAPNVAKNYKFNITIYSNGINVWNKEMSLTYESNKITGSFISIPKEASVIGLVLLALIGGGSLGLYIGERVKERIKKEKAVITNDFR